MNDRLSDSAGLDPPIVLGVKAGAVMAFVGGTLGLLAGGIGGLAESALGFGMGGAITVTVLAYIAAYRFQQMRRAGEERALVLWFFRSATEDHLSFRWHRPEHK